VPDIPVPELSAPGPQRIAVFNLGDLGVVDVDTKEGVRNRLLLALSKHIPTITENCKQDEGQYPFE
jgi:hypothetical protein